LNKQERKDYEQQLDQSERSIEAMNRLAAAFERVALAQEVNVKLQPGGEVLLDAAIATEAQLGVPQ
jgi:hypothetical protein